MRGQVAKRRCAHYGWDYGYYSARISAAKPLPELLEPLRTLAAQLTGIHRLAFEEALVSQYPEGAGIGWHRDAPIFGPTVVGFSFGAECELKLRRATEHGFERLALRLPSRSAYVLAGEARSQWQHSITSTPGLRYSVTFRTVRRSV